MRYLESFPAAAARAAFSFAASFAASSTFLRAAAFGPSFLGGGGGAGDSARASLGADEGVTCTSGTAGAGGCGTGTLGGGDGAANGDCAATVAAGTGGSGVSGRLSLDNGRGGAGTTPVMPSGPSTAFCWAIRSLSAAPPGRGLKADAAVAALAAFQNTPAISPFDFLDLIIGPRPGLDSSAGSAGIGGGERTDSSDWEMEPLSLFIRDIAGGVMPRGRGVTSGEDPPSKPPRAGPFIGELRSLLRGGGIMGSFLFIGLFSGGGTTSLSMGRDGSMGGRRRSGGGRPGSCRAFGGWSGVSRLSANRPAMPGTGGPLRDLGGWLVVSSLLAEADMEVAKESWLWLVCAVHRPGGARSGRSFESEESKLAAGEPVPPFIGGRRGPFWNLEPSGVCWRGAPEGVELTDDGADSGPAAG